MRRTIGLLLLIVFFPWQSRASSEVKSLLVFPFENMSPREDLNWISESFAQVLSSRLPQPDNYVLDRDERNAAYEQLGLPDDAPLTLASQFKVAQTLGVDWAVIGSFNVQDNHLVSHAQLLDLRQLKLSQPIEVNGDLGDMVELQTRLAWRLLATHDSSFTAGNEDDFLRQFHDIHLDAFENYIRGLIAADDASHIHFFTESDRLDPSDHRAAFALGKFYFDQKNYSDSAKWLAKIEATETNYNEALFLQAVDEFFLGKEPAAEKDFETVAKTLPLDEVLNNLGVLEARRGLYANALAHFDKAVQGDPSDADFNFNRGLALWYEGRFSDAAESLKAAIQSNPGDVETHTLLAMVYAKLGDDAAEQREYDWLGENEVGVAANQAGDVLPQPRLKKNYDGRAFRLLEVTLHNAMEMHDATVARQKQIDAHLAEARSLLAKNLHGDAEHELSEAAKLDPDNPDIHVQLGKVLEAEGKHEQAVAEMQNALSLDDSAETHVSLAHVYLAMNRTDLALAQDQAALKLEPGNQQAQQLLNQIRSWAGASGKKP
jgi:tetratricopeptide (TPR) repeat protein